MGTYLAKQGEEVEVSTQEWQVILGRSRRGAPKRQTISGYVSELEMYGWIERRPGGSGSPRYRFLQSLSGTGEKSLQSLSGLYSPSEITSTVPKRGGRASPPPLNTPVTSSSVARGAESFIEDSADVLNGCRGSLRDYLAERVEPERQLAYVQTLVGMMQGTDEWAWTDGAGNRVPLEDRSTIVAGCLNELRLGDEVGQYFPQSPGGIKNLRSKIRYKTKAVLGAKRDAKAEKAKTEAKANNRPSNQGAFPEEMA